MISDSDLALALELQQKYDLEYQNSLALHSTPKSSITKPPKRGQVSTKSDFPSASTSSSSSLTPIPSTSISYQSPNATPLRELTNLGCPKLEFADPTPNIHTLFVQFNRQFFSNTLSSVVVRWSKKMYSCAGLCRYDGKDGFCDIALSEPLLKLRSRKDLIETLLHEMIHAYLFVELKDRDREGHGPNFQLHMRRINKLANINITIYHNFIEEVRLYQTHRWRCDGRCRNLKPYFGIIRRSANRAPGPSDFWWRDHSTFCGGKFIKINEPTPKKKCKEDKNVKDKSLGNIKDYFTPIENKAFDKNLYTPPAKKAKVDNSHFGNDEVLNRVRDHWNKKYLLPSGSQTCSKTQINNEVTLIKDEISTKTPIQIISTPNTTSPKSYNDVFKEIYGNDVSLSPDHFKKKKQGTNGTDNNDCPLCNKTVFNLETHLPKCIGDTEPNDKEIELIDLTHIAEEKTHYKIKDCPCCNKPIRSTELEVHLETCLNETHFSDSKNDLVYSDDEDDLESKNGSVAPCPCCLELIEVNLMNDHLDHCVVY